MPGRARGGGAHGINFILADDSIYCMIWIQAFHIWDIGG